MSKISKWLPFKFERRKRDKQQEAEPVPAPFESMLPDRFFGDFAPRMYCPHVDIVDDGKHIRVTAELPGLYRDDVEVTIQEGLLILRGEKHNKHEAEEQGCYRVERYFGHFQRAVALPSDVDTDRAEAKLDRGVLTIRLPKTSDGGSVRRLAVS